MSTYLYRAINDRGRQMRGEISADNDVDLETRLHELGLDLVGFKIAKTKEAGKFSRVKHQDMIILCLHLEQLGRAGVPLLEAIADVRDASESAKLRDVLASVYENVKNGEIFSAALSRHPRYFDEVFLGLIRAGERTGDMSEIYTHLADHFKWTHMLKRKVRKAMGYPIFLLIVMSAVISVLMIFVVPKLITFITAQGFAIPIHTRALIAFSSAFQHYWYLMFGTPIFIAIFLTTFYRLSENFAYNFDNFMLHMPFIGKTVRKINMARFTHFFSIMFKSGIDVLDSLEAAGNVMSNRVLKDTIGTVKRSVSDGQSLTASLRISNQFPMLVVRMFKVGEESGNMNDALENVNFFYNREVTDAVDAMVGMIQPALTIVMGVLIFWVVSAVFGPLYDSFSKMPF